MEGELKAQFCLAWTSSCDFSGKLLRSLQGRDAEMPLLLGRVGVGGLHSAGCARGSFPEMWRLEEKTNGMVAL